MSYDWEEVGGVDLHGFHGGSRGMCLQVTIEGRYVQLDAIEVHQLMASLDRWLRLKYKPGAERNDAGNP